MNSRLRTALLGLLISWNYWLCHAAVEVQYSMDPRAKPAIAKGITYIKSKFGDTRGGYRTLAAYAMVKAGDPPTNPMVVQAIGDIRAKMTSDGYRATDGHYAIYEAGMDLMFLCDVNPGEHKAMIEAIVNYLKTTQNAAGFWTYPGETDPDTSITQYAMLGLWAAERTGMQTDLGMWGRAANWLMRTQMADGGFSYRPGTTGGFDMGKSAPSMTNAGTGCLLIARIYLYPDRPYYGQTQTQKRFGLLEDARQAELQAQAENRRKSAGEIPTIAALDASIGRGLAWINSHWTTQSSNAFRAYFFYTMERVGALTGGKTIGPHDWFEECLPPLLKSQKADGSWDDHSHLDAATALNVLFLTRTTGKIIEKMNIAGGLQTGGRGLPDDLAKAAISKGKLKDRKSQGGLDDLLSELANQDTSALEDAQTAIVEKVQIGNREELLGQLDTLRRLIKHPSAEVRRTAAWALGRSGQLQDARLLIDALHDVDVDVLVEANASLRFLSRKLAGVGVAESPFQDLPENADDTAKRAAVAAWRREALKRWTAWFTRVRPFEQRNDLFELLNRDLPDEKPEKK